MICAPGSYLLESMTFQLEPELPARFLRVLRDCHVQALVNGEVVADRIIGTLPATPSREHTRILFPIHHAVKAGDVVLGVMCSAGLVAPSCGFKVKAGVSVLSEVVTD